MSETTLQFIGILITVAGLLGWLIKQVISFFIKSSEKRTGYIEELVAQNQKNTINFVNTINHQRTKDREMQAKLWESMESLSKEIKISSEVNSKMLILLKDK